MENFLLDRKIATEKDLKFAGYRKYFGKEIDVYYNAQVCKHVAACLKGLPVVFDTEKKPWIQVDNADSINDVIRVVNTCPTGALKYVVHDQDEG
ncbi:MAG: (4Fe-4S)-binding protein [Lactobacillales bacterium]|jgi:uncharacterized Fe-S cluster protein YjdI|nr:(4Fe-4S)-binding protein [Lactobacillales bacterium]